jgi:hypothetical protein
VAVPRHGPRGMRHAGADCPVVTVLRLLAMVAGIALVASALLSAMKTIVLPRAEASIVAAALFINLRRVFDRVCSPKRSFAFRDRIMAYYAPVVLLLLPVTWVTMVLLGYTGIYWGTGIEPLAEALAISGSSLFTLGFDRPADMAHIVVSFTEALIGLGIVALVISYLPSIYGAFSRREALVATLEVRAGLPPSPVELLARYARIGWLDRLGEELFPSWERWFAEIEESHTSQSALNFLRSPHPGRSWITAAGCVLDTAAIANSAIAKRHDARADLLLRGGYLCLRRISDFFGIPYDHNPRPDDPISVTRTEFDVMCAELDAAGIPLKEDRDQAWRDFAGWRVNYDAVLVELCALVMAPPAVWSSDRVMGPRRRIKIARRTRLSRI